jgi:hypothetical protein
MNWKSGSAALCILLFLFILPGLSLGQEFLKMPKPTHTEDGIRCAKLTLVKEIEPDFTEDLFLATPWSISVGDKFFYVYDSKLIKVFLFDHKFKYIKQFPELGRGPGEAFPGNGLSKEIYAGLDGNFYLHDAQAVKIIKFTANGKYIDDLVLKSSANSFIPFSPVVDKDGFLYVHSINGGIVDRLDPKKNVTQTYLDLNANWQFVVYQPPYKISKNEDDTNYYKRPTLFNTMYDLTSDGHLLIFLYRSSRVFLFNGNTLVKQFSVLIDRLLPLFKKKVVEKYKQKKERNLRSVSVLRMYSSCFVSKDEPCFYLQFGEENLTSTLYKIDFNGKILKMFNEIPANIKTTKNGLFYGLAFSDRHPMIFKEGTK